MLYIAAAIFLISFFAIRKMSKDYFNNQVEKLIKIIDEENVKCKYKNIKWAIEEDCDNLNVEFLSNINAID